MPAANSGATPLGLPRGVCERIVAVFGDYPEIDRVRVFGSRAKGNYRPASDIDLCLDAPALSPSRRLELENRLDDLLLPWKIDLLVREEIDNLSLLEHIERVGVTLA